MLNAKRIFFIVVSNVYEAFDFAASEFIQLLIRKAHPPRACFVGTRKHLNSNDTDKRGWGADSLPAVCAPRRSRLNAWPSRRVRCSGGRAETIFHFTTMHTKLTEIF